MKNQLASLEINALANELQVLVNGRIDQIYQPKKKSFFISIHVPQKGKHLLKIELPGFLYLTSQKTEMPPPSEFCLSLRRHLNNSVIKSIRQVHPERIVEITAEKERELKLIIELFSKGNLFLADKQNKIIALEERQKWGERELKPNQIYSLPPSPFNYFDATLEKIKELVKTSQKNKIVTCLASEVGLGGTYAEELCLINNIDKTQKPKELTESQIKSIHQTIKEFIQKTKNPLGIVYPKDITPFPLELYKDTQLQKFDLFNQALDHLLGKTSIQLQKERKEAQFQEKIDKLKRILKEQENTVKKQEEKEQEFTQKANHVYEKYQLIDNLLKKTKQAKKKMTWEEIKKEFQKHPQIRQVNLKEKKLILQL